MTAYAIFGARSGHYVRAACASVALAVLMCWAGAVGAQEPIFTYQGQLTEAGTPANGDYDFQFALFAAEQGGTQIGAMQTRSAVAVSNGLFTVQLDFGVSAFPGENRFLEIGVHPAGGGTFTTLTPRQQISSTPYAIRTLRAASADALSSTCTGCVQDSQIQSVAGGKVTGTIPVASVPSGSGNYIQNTTTEQPNANFNISGNGVIDGDLTVGGAFNANIAGNFIQNRTSEQPDANFNISGDGTVGGALSGNLVNARTQYNLNGSHVLSSPGTDNLFAGRGAGASNTSGNGNAFFGRNAGASNISGTQNAFFGTGAGASTIDTGNSFFGNSAGFENTTGSTNSFFGASAGRHNTMGAANAFFGTNAGLANTTGARNSLFGHSAGDSNTAGNNNTVIGYFADVLSGDLTNATAIGANAHVGISNALVLGSEDINVGIGTTAPKQKLHVVGQGVFTSNPTAFDPGDQAGPAIRIGYNSTDDYGYINANNTGFAAKNLILQGNFSQGSVGIGTTAPDQRLTVIGNASKSAGGTTWAVFSDDRLKSIKGPFTPGLNALLRLQPIRYEYKPDNGLGLKAGDEQVGFSAQAVQQVLPDAVSRTRQGYLQLQSDRILWTMLNAIREQHQAIEQLRGEVQQLRRACPTVQRR